MVNAKMQLCEIDSDCVAKTSNVLPSVLPIYPT